MRAANDRHANIPKLDRYVWSTKDTTTQKHCSETFHSSSLTSLDLQKVQSHCDTSNEIWKNETGALTICAKRHQAKTPKLLFDRFPKVRLQYHEVISKYRPLKMASKRRQSICTAQFLSESHPRLDFLSSYARGQEFVPGIYCQRPPPCCCSPPP